MLILLAPAPAGAQAPPAWSYYPLRVGDAWEYTEPGTGNTLRVHVARDTVMNEREYVIQERRRFDSAGTPLPHIPPFYRLRYDSVSTHVVEPFTDGSGTEVPSRPAPCPLGATNGQSVDCGAFGGMATVQQFTAGLTIGDTLLTGVHFKEYETNAAIATYAAGIGETELWAKFEPYRYLTYARVGGIEYGDPLYPVAVEAPPERPGLLPSVAIWPNPSEGRAAVALFARTNAPVRLSILDILGRTAMTLDVGILSHGHHVISLDLSELDAGAYLIVIAGEDLHVSAPFVHRE